MRTMQVLSQSTVITAVALNQAVNAIQTQLTTQFSPIWDVDLTLQIVTVLDPTKETMIVVDDPTQADALGYHTLLPNTTIPRGFVFARLAIALGLPWQAILSHEVLEQAVNPFLQEAWVGTWKGVPAALAYEVNDPCQADSYLIGGIKVSNFVCPAWFDESASIGTRMDWMGLLTAPCTLRLGGYQAVSFDLKTWDLKVITGATHDHYTFDPPAARYSRKNRLLDLLNKP